MVFGYGNTPVNLVMCVSGLVFSVFAPLHVYVIVLMAFQDRQLAIQAVSIRTVYDLITTSHDTL